MKYVMLLMGQMDGERCSEGDGPTVEEFMAFDAELEAAGVLAGGFALHGPETATSVSRTSRDGEAVVTAGPYAESREFVGGTIVIDVADLDAAIGWARRCPGSLNGRVEIRPLAEF